MGGSSVAQGEPGAESGLESRGRGWSERELGLKNSRWRKRMQPSSQCGGTPLYPHSVVGHHWRVLNTRVVQSQLGFGGHPSCHGCGASSVAGGSAAVEWPPRGQIGQAGWEQVCWVWREAVGLEMSGGEMGRMGHRLEVGVRRKESSAAFPVPVLSNWMACGPGAVQSRTHRE